MRNSGNYVSVIMLTRSSVRIFNPMRYTGSNVSIWYTNYGIMHLCIIMILLFGSIMIEECIIVILLLKISV